MMKKLSISLLIFALSLSFMAASASAKNTGRAKNVIIMIGDGMGPAHIRAAQLYSERLLKKELNMIRLMKNSRLAYIENDTADTVVTESAAAAGQIAAGQKMKARSISMAADEKTPLKTLLEMAEEKGMATGLVTTSGITDATPAAFSAHSNRRDDEKGIAVQQINSGVEVLLGGRRAFFLPETKGGKRDDGRNLIEEAKKSGYSFVETAAGLRNANGVSKLLGLFNMKNLAFEIERERTAEPSFVEMTKAAIDILSKNKNGFFLMAEGGRIDHASHNNDTAAMIHEMLAFDEAVGAAMAYAEKDSNTLVIVTADHETGGFAIIGNSKESEQYIGLDFECVSKATRSYEALYEVLRDDVSPASIRTAVKKYAGVDLTTEEAELVAADPIKNMDPYNFKYKFNHSLAFVLRPYYRAAWASHTHTATPVFLFGCGPGSSQIKGVMHNTEIFEMVKSAMRLK